MTQTQWENYFYNECKNDNLGKLSPKNQEISIPSFW